MPPATRYHHGDLPAALVRAAMELLEEGGSSELSLRAAARRAGVSSAAPYRHFTDRHALLSAVAAVGYGELAERLAAAHPAPRTADDLAALAVAYVQFALERPGLFHVMFVEQSDPAGPEQAAAVEAIHGYLKDIAGKAFPEVDAEAVSTAMWALTHGLACLHLHGNLEASAPGIVANRVRAAVRASLAASLRPSQAHGYQHPARQS